MAWNYGVMAGIDLLGKFLYSDVANEVSKRFKNVVSNKMKLGYQEELYQLRNSLLHSFGLFSEGKNGKVYRFTLTRGKHILVDSLPNDVYEIDIYKLWNAFEEVIETYRLELIDDVELQKTFTKMLPKYGGIEIS
jgi:hypothetical protein